MRHRMVVPPGARRDDFPLKRKGNRDPVPGFRSAERRRLVPAEPYEKESERDLGPRLAARVLIRQFTFAVRSGA